MGMLKGLFRCCLSSVSEKKTAVYVLNMSISNLALLCEHSVLVSSSKKSISRQCNTSTQFRKASMLSVLRSQEVPEHSRQDNN